MVTILTGTNDYLLRAELHRLIDDFKSEHGDLALERLDAEEIDFNRVNEALSSPPFLASKKMVVLSGAAGNKDITEHIDDLLAAADDTVDFLIVEPKPDKRGVYYKTLKKQKGFKEFAEQDENSLSRWLSEEAKGRGGELSNSAARKIVDRVGPNQRILAGELDKLLLHDPKITDQDIENMVEASPRSSIFEMLEAAFGGNAKKALKLYAEQRQQRVDPQAMLALIAWQLHILALVKSAGDRTPGEIAKEGGVSPYVVSKSMSITRRLSMQEIKDLISETLRLDIRLKSEAIDADSALQNLLITIAN